MHVLNIYGTVGGVVREDDADMFVSVSQQALSGVWNRADERFTGPDGARLSIDSVSLDDAFPDLLAGRVVVEVATVRNPDGELRGALRAVGAGVYPVRLSGGAFQLTIATSSPRWLRIHTSADLTEWTPLTNLVVSGGVSRILDAEAAGQTRRFYRLLEEFLIHPSLVTEPESASVPVGGALTLVAEGEGNPPVAYYWQRNSVTIPGATDATFRIEDVQASDAASYRVVVSNAVGVVSSRQAVVTVGSP